MATPEGTRSYFQRLENKNIPEHAIKTLGSTNFHVSNIGFGGYRVHHNSIEHAKALRYALLNGFNLIDTSSNYTDGGSEMLIGNLLDEMLEREEIYREEIVIISKVGYIQSQNMELVKQAAADGTPFPEVVEYQDTCWHCIHPDFLENQLSLTLERLRVSALDVYLLHNPEYYLSDKQRHNGIDIEEAQKSYYQRLGKAFEWMEEKVAEGKIKAYGISSNTLPAKQNDFQFTSLEEIIKTAKNISSQNYFKVIQFPFNLFEVGALTEKNNAGQTLLDFAKHHNLGTLINRPLNATFNNRMVRIASFRESEANALIDAFHKKLVTLQRLEKQFADKLIKKMPREVNTELVTKIFSLSTNLKDAFTIFEDWEHWDHIKQNMILPQNFSLLTYFTNNFKEEKDLTKWAETYGSAVVDFLDIITRKYENDAQERTFKLSGRLKSLNETLADSETLSQQALRVLTSMNKIDCTLLGMRRIPYVEDALMAMKAPLLENAEDILLKFNFE